MEFGSVFLEECADSALRGDCFVRFHHLWCDRESLAAATHDIAIEQAILALDLVLFGATVIFSFESVAVVEIL